MLQHLPTQQCFRHSSNSSIQAAEAPQPGRESVTGVGRGGGGTPTKLWRNTTVVYSNTDPDRDKETTENAHENDPYSAEEMINEAKRTRQGA